VVGPAASRQGADLQAPAVGVCLYAVPTPYGTALVAPAGALAALRDLGYLLAEQPAGVRVELLVARQQASEPLEREAVMLLRRAASGAALGLGLPAKGAGRKGAAPSAPAAGAPDGSLRRIGPGGRWYAALVAWGWLLLVATSENLLQVAGGLWLAAGLPLARRAWRRREAEWTTRGAAGLWPVTGRVTVRQHVHAGLEQLGGVVEGHGDQPQRACGLAAQACRAAGLAELVPFFAALATGSAPPGIWAPLPARVAAEPVEGAAEPENRLHHAGQVAAATTE
jgi:hypothetical protein